MYCKGYTVSQKENNEDIYLTSDKWAVVLDGATNLGVTNQWNAHWFVNQLSDYLKEELPKMEQNLENCLAKAVEKTRAHTPDGFNEVSASGVFVREEGEEICCYGIGDCTTVVFFHNAPTEILYNTSLSVLDQISIDLTVEVSKKMGISMVDAIASPTVQAKLLQHRNMKNTPEGYYTCDPQGSGIPFGDTCKFKKDSVKALLLMSDGFADIVGKFDVFPTHDFLLKEISETTLEAVAHKLFQVQEGDRDMKTFPRLKFSDDTTAVLVMLQE